MFLGKACNIVAPAVKAGMRGSIGMHLLMHTMATRFVGDGGSVALLKDILGHEELETTQQYLHASAADLKQAHQRHSCIVKAARRRVARKPAA